MLNIPEEVHKEHMEFCEKCGLHRHYAQKFDLHFDWLDCPFVCRNDYETWKKAQKDG